MTFARFSLLAASLLLPRTALADYGFVESTVNAVGNALPFLAPTGACTGDAACGFVDLADAVIGRFRPLLSVAGLLAIVFFGYRMIVAQEDDIVTKARGAMSGTIAGLVMVYLIEPFIHAFYGTSGEVPRGAMAEGAALLSAEVSGIINWALVIAAALAITMICVTVVKSFGQATSEEAVGNMRKTIFSVAFGILLLVFRFVLSEGFVESTGNPAPLLVSALRPVSFVMGFLGMLSLIVVVYAGFRYVLSLGKEEEAGKAKGMLLRAATGAMVIMVSLALVNFVIIPTLQ
jgi:hypothetical protein